MGMLPVVAVLRSDRKETSGARGSERYSVYEKRRPLLFVVSKHVVFLQTRVHTSDKNQMIQ